MRDKLTSQLVTEIRSQAAEIERLQHGQIVLKIQDGKVVSGQIIKGWRADSNKREA
ncbi:MAG: DUF2292 domain-containing protein [Firmicutes bacterium]|nr:DUF2292 domain-containing protein [Bacillota bacterium]